MPVTLKELAARAQVHPSTVSRVANNDPSLRIAQATRTRIEALLRETEYRPSDEGVDPFVGSDDVTGAMLATQHLIGLGHVRIGHLAGQPTVSTGVLRRKGYHAALSDAGIAADLDLLVESGFVEEGGAQAMERLLSLDRPPTAAFAVTDMTAVGAYGVARRRGLRIPEDLAIVGYNDIPLAARLIPGLTTVHVPIHEFGSVAARMVLEQIETGVLTPRRVGVAPPLGGRGSSLASADEQGLRGARGPRPAEGRAG